MTPTPEPLRPEVSPQQLATMLVALLYWSEEMIPHGPNVMRPYFEDLEIERLEPLTASEIQQLLRRLRTTISTSS